MLDEKQLGLLRDMLDSARQIQSYLTGLDRDGFSLNIEQQDAVLRRFEIVGEAASRVTKPRKSLRIRNVGGTILLEAYQA